MSDGRPEPQVVVAGHICLDVIPSFDTHAQHGGAHDAAQLLQPGKLVNVGPALLATGGAVSNTGLALHRLGVPTRLMGMIGGDLFGKAVLDIVRGYDPALAEGMIVDRDAFTSYTIVIEPPGLDRMFLHAPGANDSFTAAHVPLFRLEGARLFHFGYPPIMRQFYGDDGDELARLMQQVKARGLVTSLDMAYPDPNSDAGRADWRAILTRALPFVDVFLPSLEETLFMLDRNRHDTLNAQGGILRQADGALLADLAGELLDMGAAIVGLKLGDQGFYVRTTSDPARLDLPPLPQLDTTWSGRELLAPCFQVQVAGTTGAGDCTIAGFLAGLLAGQSLPQTLTSAVAVGACNVERADSLSGVPDWGTLQTRLAAGWAREEVALNLPGWTWHEANGLWSGPHDTAT